MGAQNRIDASVALVVFSIILGALSVASARFSAHGVPFNEQRVRDAVAASRAAEAANENFQGSAAERQAALEDVKIIEKVRAETKQPPAR